MSIIASFIILFIALIGPLIGGGSSILYYATQHKLFNPIYFTATTIFFWLMGFGLSCIMYHRGIKNNNNLSWLSFIMFVVVSWISVTALYYRFSIGSEIALMQTLNPNLTFNDFVTTYLKNFISI